MLCSLSGAVEEKGAEDRDPHTVPQHCQVHLSELKGCWVLIPQLPHTVQKQQEQRRLQTERIWTHITYVNKVCHTSASYKQTNKILESNWYKLHYLLFITLLQMVAAVQEPMASHHPFFLNQTLEAMQAPAVRITHQLHQTGNHTTQVPILLLCTHIRNKGARSFITLHEICKILHLRY